MPAIRPVPASRRRRAGLVLLLLAALATAAAAQGPVLDVPDDPDFLVVRYGLLDRHLDDSIEVKVWGDGRVEVHRPSYLRHAGDYEVRLSAAELHQLVSELARHGVLSFDATAIREQLDRAEASRQQRKGSVVHVTAGATVEIEVGLRRYVPVGGAAVDDFRRTVSWSGARAEARLYPEVAALHGIMAAEDTLLRLALRGDLRRRTDGRRIEIGD